MAETTVEILIDTPKCGWSHVVCNDLQVLHQFASQVGLKQEWFQDKTNRAGQYQPHYDIKAHRAHIAIGAGARQVTRRELYEFLEKHFTQKKVETNEPTH